MWTFKRTSCRQSLWNFLYVSIKYSLGSLALINLFREENQELIQDVSGIEETKEASQATFLPTSQLSLLLFRCLQPLPPLHLHQPGSRLPPPGESFERSLLTTIQLMALMCPPVSTNMQLQHSKFWDRQRGGNFSLVGPACQDIKNNVDNIKSLKTPLREYTNGRRCWDRHNWVQILLLSFISYVSMGKSQLPCLYSIHGILLWAITSIIPELGRQKLKDCSECVVGLVWATWLQASLVCKVRPCPQK